MVDKDALAVLAGASTGQRPLSTDAQLQVANEGAAKDNTEGRMDDELGNWFWRYARGQTDILTATNEDAVKVATERRLDEDKPVARLSADLSASGRRGSQIAWKPTPLTHRYDLALSTHSIHTERKSAENPKTIINSTTNLFFNCNQHFGNFKP